MVVITNIKTSRINIIRLLWTLTCRRWRTRVRFSSRTITSSRFSPNWTLRVCTSWIVGTRMSSGTRGSLVPKTRITSSTKQAIMESLWRRTRRSWIWAESVGFIRHHTCRTTTMPKPLLTWANQPSPWAACKSRFRWTMAEDLGLKACPSRHKTSKMRWGHHLAKAVKWSYSVLPVAVPNPL